MSAGRCPGQDGRNLKATIQWCSNCGAEVEMFSDETRAKCHRCGTYVYQEEIPSCIEWCAKARECIGEERWEQIQEQARKSQ